MASLRGHREPEIWNPKSQTWETSPREAHLMIFFLLYTFLAAVIQKGRGT
jgi:hypothetical protein